MVSWVRQLAECDLVCGHTGGERMGGKERRYIAYLVRLWQIEREGQLVWQASLEDSRTGKRQGFSSVEALFDFVRRQMDSTPASRGDKDETDESG